MKKLVACGLMGAMLMAGQGLAFAGDLVEQVKATMSTPAIMVENVDGEVVKAQAVTPEMDQEKIKEICEALGLDYKEMEGKYLGEVLGELTEAQIEKLAESSVIEVMAATVISEEAIAAEGQEHEAGEIVAVKMTEAAKTVAK